MTTTIESNEKRSQIPSLAIRASIARSEQALQAAGIEEGKRKVVDLRQALNTLYQQIPQRDDPTFNYNFRDDYKRIVFYVPTELPEEEPVRVLIHDGPMIATSGLQITVGNETLHVWDGYHGPLVSRPSETDSGNKLTAALGSEMDEYIDLINHIKDLGLRAYTEYEKPTSQ